MLDVSSFTNISDHQIDNDLMQISITTEFPSYVKKVYNQFKERGFDFVQDVTCVPEESKLFCTIPVNKLWKITTLAKVERIFLHLYSMPIEDENHPLLCDAAGYRSFLDDIHSKVNFNKVTDIWQKYYNKQPLKWTAVVRRAGGKTTSLYKNVDVEALSTSFRESIDCILSNAEYREGRPIIQPHRKQEADFQIFFRIVPRRLTVGIPILTRRIRKQYVFVHKGLHHSACWGLGKLAQLKAGEVCADLMCGKGSILCEAADFFPGVFFLGSDSAAEIAIEHARKNIEFNENAKGCVDIWVGDATHNNLRDGIVDIVIADLPFGVQMGSLESNKILYPPYVRELNRVLRSGGRAVLLTSEMCGTILTEALQEFQGLNICGIAPMRLGSINTVIFLVRKNISNEDYQSLNVFDISDLPEVLSKSDFVGGRPAFEAREGRAWEQVNWKDLKPALVLSGKSDD